MSASPRGERERLAAAEAEWAIRGPGRRVRVCVCVCVCGARARGARRRRAPESTTARGAAERIADTRPEVTSHRVSSSARARGVSRRGRLGRCPGEGQGQRARMADGFVAGVHGGSEKNNSASRSERRPIGGCRPAPAPGCPVACAAGTAGPYRDRAPSLEGHREGRRRPRRGAGRSPRQTAPPTGKRNEHSSRKGPKRARRSAAMRRMTRGSTWWIWDMNTVSPPRTARARRRGSPVRS